MSGSDRMQIEKPASRRALGPEESFLGFLEAQPSSPFSHNSCHQDRIRFVVAQVQDLEPESLKLALRRVDISKPDSTFESLMAVQAAQMIPDEELLSLFVDRHPSSTIQRRSAKALARLGNAEALKSKLFGNELSQQMKGFIIDLLPTLDTTISPQVAELTATLKGSEAAACLACRCGDQSLIESYTMGRDELLWNGRNTRVRNAIKAAIARFPKLAEVWLSWRYCPAWMQETILEFVGKRRHLERTAEGEPSMFELFTKCEHLDTKWFLAKHVPAQVVGIRTEYDESKNQASLYLPVCQTMEFFDDTFTWFCKSRLAIDPIGTLELIQLVSDKRPGLNLGQLSTHRTNMVAIADLCKSNNKSPAFRNKWATVSYCLFRGLLERDRLVGQDAIQQSVSQKRSFLHPLELRNWTNEQLKTLIDAWPTVLTELTTWLPGTKGKHLSGEQKQSRRVQILRLYLNPETPRPPCKNWSDPDVSETLMSFLYRHCRELWQLQVDRVKQMVKGFELEKAPEWFRLQLPYFEVEKLLKQECRGKDAMGPQRVSKFQNLITSAFRTGDTAIADVLKHLSSTLKTERDDNRGEILEYLFSMLVPEEAVYKSRPSERVWGEPSEEAAADTRSQMDTRDDVSSVSSSYSFIDTFSERMSLGVQESVQAASPIEDGPWFLREHYIPLLEKLLMYNLQAKGTSGNSSKAWTQLAVRILSRGIVFGYGPTAKIIRFGSGILHKLSMCRIISEDVRLAQLRQVHRLVSFCPLGKKARMYSEASMFAIKASNSILRSHTQSTLLYSLIYCEDCSDNDRAQYLRELLSFERNFAMLVHRKRQDLLSFILDKGPQDDIPIKFNPVMSRFRENPSKLHEASVRQEMVDELYSGMPFLASSPQVLKTLWSWHPKQQQAFYENWILPVMKVGEVELPAQVRSCVIETGSNLDLVDRLESLEKTLESCSDGLQDETLEPAERGMIGRLGEDIINYLGAGDRAQACCEILVKHSFTGISKMAVVQLGKVMKRVGLTTVADVITAIVKDKSIRLGGKVALVKISIELDVPDPMLLLTQWENGECHREVGVAFLTSLLDRPHLTQAHPILLAKPIQDLRDNLQNVEASKVSKKDEQEKDFATYTTLQFLTHARDTEGALQPSWLQSEVGVGLLQFVATVAETCHGKLRETAVECLANVFYSKRPTEGEVNGELTYSFPASYAAAAKALEVVFADALNHPLDHVWVYEHAANLLFALAQKKYCGLSYLKRILTILTQGWWDAVSHGNRKAVERCTVIVHKLCSEVKDAGLLLIYGSTFAESFDTLCKEILIPVMDGVPADPVNLMVVPVLWSRLLTFGHKSGEETFSHVASFCTRVEKSVPASLHKEIADRFAEGLVSLDGCNPLNSDTAALLQMLNSLVPESASGVQGLLAHSVVHQLLQRDFLNRLNKPQRQSLDRILDVLSMSVDKAVVFSSMSGYLKRNRAECSSDAPRKSQRLTESLDGTRRAFNMGGRRT